MKSKTNQIRLGAMISYFAIAISIISALLYTPWMKDSIGDANYGLYTLAGSLIAIFMMDFGLGTSVTRFIAKYRAENKQDSIDDVLGYVARLYLIIDVIIASVLVVVYFLIENIYTGLNQEELLTFKKVFVVIGSYSVLSFPFTPLSGIMNAYEQFIQLKLCDLFQKLFAIVLIVVALTLDYGVVALVAMNAVSGLSTIAIKLYIISRKIGIHIAIHPRDKSILRSLLSFSLWVTVLAFAQRMIFNVAPSILGITANSMEIARFAPASQLEGYFFTFAYAINGLFLPTVARYEAVDQEKQTMQLLIKVGKYQIIVLGLLFAGIATIGSDFMALWMGEDYKISGICTTLMIFPSLLMYPQQIANTLITVRGKVKYQAISALMIGVINICLSFMLTPHMGALGSAISICVAYFINFILLNYVYHKHLNLHMASFYRNVYMKFLPIIALSIAIGLVIVQAIKTPGWIGIGVKATVVAFEYTCLIFVLGFSGEDRCKIKDWVYRKKN